MAPTAKRRRVSPPEEARDSPAPSSGKVNSESRALLQKSFYNQAAEWDLEQDYEEKALKRNKKGKENTRLPIKTQDGKIERQHVPILEEVEKDDDDWLEEDTDLQDTTTVQDDEATQYKIEVPLRQQILEAKEELAKIAGHINEDPEENAGGFRALAQIAAHPHATIKKLAMVTQLAVYKDAIPGYRIRPIAEADQTEKVSKEVRKLRAFEQTMISAYQAYLKTLSHLTSQRAKSDDAPSVGLASVALSCACALLIAVPHFNFRGELLKILVDWLGTRKRDADFDKCLDTLETFFHDDEDGTPSLDAVSLITKMMKSRGYRVDENVLNLFLQLRLLSEFSSKASQNQVDKEESEARPKGGKKPKFKKEFRTKKLRKVLKERKEVEKEFEEADAIVGHEHRDKMQAETLKLVFVTYFRVLKARVPQLMGAVLEGLAKYAHLINQDFFGDLLEVLKELLDESVVSPDDKILEDSEDDTSIKPQRSHRNSARESLLCTTTAFALLEGQDVARSASALNLDLTFFITHLYSFLHDLSLNADIELSAKSLRLPDPHNQHQASITSSRNAGLRKVNVQTTTVLLIRALSCILVPRHVAPNRLAAFTKQLYTCTLHLPERSDLAVLGLLGNVTKTHSRKIAALWNTEERKGNGVFDVHRKDPEGSNPFATTIWEGELLKWHYCPGVRASVRDVERSIAEVS